MPNAALSATDHPVNGSEIETIKRTEERLGTDEAHARWYPPQGIGALRDIHVFDGGPHPDVVCPRHLVREPQGALGPLGEHLELVPRRSIHHLEDTLNHLEGEVRVKHVRHAVDEHAPGLSPMQGLIESLWPEARGERVSSGLVGIFYGELAKVDV